MTYLIAGLGNFGDKYHNTRHNIGFMVLDSLASDSGISFEDGRYGFTATLRYRSRNYILLKPSTYMNLSGRAVDYWLKKRKVPIENLLVVVDDIALPAGSFRMRLKGGSGGHNGLANISSVLGTDNYARIRVGIGNGFARGSQSRFVLDQFTPAELQATEPSIKIIAEMIKSFGTIGAELTMTKYNAIGKRGAADSGDEDLNGSIDGLIP